MQSLVIWALRSFYFVYEIFSRINEIIPSRIIAVIIAKHAMGTEHASRRIIISEIMKEFAVIKENADKTTAIMPPNCINLTLILLYPVIHFSLGYVK